MFDSKVGLKQDLKDFEQVFHENLIKGVYHQWLKKC